jgi:fatty acid CoA ligase FadD36
VDLIPTLSTGGGRPHALTVGGRSLGWEELAGAAGAVAEKLAGMERVAIEATPQVETVVAVVGALAAGVTVVPVPPDAGPMEREHIMRDSGASLFPGSVDLEATADLPGVALRPDRIAMILYTSGTTGLPKGVMLSASAIATDLDLLAAAWEWTDEDVLVHGLPLFHVHGLILGVIGSLRVGGSLVHTGRPTPDLYAAAGGSLYFGVPTVWARIASDATCASALRGARLLVSGSAGLPVPVFDTLVSRCGQGPIERYGMTETLITISGSASGERRPGWVGLPLPAVSTRLVDESGAAVPHDGETVASLEVRAPTVTAGYVNSPGETAALFSPDGWVRTGDAASVSPDGWHRIVGRTATDLIKSGGFRIGAGEVEAALLAHPAVSEAAVVGEPDDDLGQVVVAYVVLSGSVGSGELERFVSSNLSAHKRPRKVITLEDLPRNAMGKVQKKLLLGR